MGDPYQRRTRSPRRLQQSVGERVGGGDALQSVISAYFGQSHTVNKSSQ